LTSVQVRPEEVDPGLDRGLRRLMLVRLLIVTTLLLIAAYVEAISENLLPANPLYFVIGAAYGVTVLHAIALRLSRASSVHVVMQVAGDLLLVTFLVYVTGGGRVGFILLYPLSVLSGAVLVGRRTAAILAATATLSHTALLLLVWTERIPAQGLFDVPFLPPRALAYSAFVTGLTCLAVGLSASYFSENLKRAGKRIAEVSLEAADLRLMNDLIVDSIQSGLATLGTDGRITWINPFGLSILGRSFVEVLHRPASIVFGAPTLEPTAALSLLRGGGRTRIEVAVERSDGAEVELGLSIAPLAGGADRDGALLVFQDLTEVRRLENEVRVKEKLAAVGEMAAQLAHEIRNPLGSISGSAQVLMSEPGMSVDQVKLLDIITTESRRLSDALSRFLFETKPSAAEHMPVDLAPLVERAVALLRNGSEVRPEHRILFEVDPGPHVCRADADRITQVFWNLARNGLEAMPEGGELEVRLSREDSSIVLSVADEGRGFRGEDQRRFFEPFRSGSPLGTGLGLAIVYRIVREHRGDISVSNRPGKGTSVQVRLPALLGQEAAEAPSGAGFARQEGR